MDNEIDAAQRPLTNRAQKNDGMRTRVPKEARAQKPTVINTPKMIDTLQHSIVSSSVLTGPISSEIVAANPNRRLLIIQNIGTVLIFLGYGTDAGVKGQRLPPGTERSFEYIVGNNEISAMSLTPGELSITEGVVL